MDQLYPDPFSTTNSTLQKAFAQYFMKSFQRLLTTRLRFQPLVSFMKILGFPWLNLWLLHCTFLVDWRKCENRKRQKIRIKLAPFASLISVSDPILNKTSREIFKLANFPGLAAELEAVSTTNNRQWLWDSWSTRVTSWHQLWDA